MYTTYDPTKICKQNEVCYCNGCRNPECRKDHSQKTTIRQRNRRRIWDKDWKPPRKRIAIKEPREHLLFLQLNGIGIDEVSRLSGISHRTIWSIRRGKQKFVYSDTRDKILAIGAHLGRKDIRATNWFNKTA